MIPLRDTQRSYSPPVVTVLIIVFNAVAFFYELSLDPFSRNHLISVYGVVPDHLSYLSLVASMFLHGGWMHLIGNMLYLAVFGRNVEDIMGRGRFLAFYLICGLVAAATHIAFNAASPVPTVGASGAISGVLGAFLVLYPRTTVRMFVFIFVVRIRAWLVLIYWFALQALGGLSELNQISPTVSGGTAVWAHVGGFLAGVALARLFVNQELLGAWMSGSGPGEVV